MIIALLVQRDGSDDGDDGCRLGRLMKYDRPEDRNDFLPVVDGERDILSSVLCAVSTGLGPASSDTTTDSVVDDCVSVATATATAVVVAAAAVVVVIASSAAAALTVSHLRLCPIDDRGRLQQRGLLVATGSVFILFVTMFLRRPPLLASEDITVISLG